MPIFNENDGGLDFRELRFDRIDGGINLKFVENQINLNQSPYMVNMNADDRGALTKRSGQKVLHTFSEGSVHQLAWYKNVIVAHHGTKLSKYDRTTDTETLLISGLANSKGSFFAMNDVLYYINGTDFISYNGLTAGNVTGYIPTIAISVPPAGGGTTNEDFNLIQPGFKVSFSGNGTATAFQLPVTNLDATLVTATVDGVAKTETTHFTVNRTTGVVTFTSAPSALTPNNTVITAYKTNAGATDKIKNCKYAIAYGGTNDTRIFITGNQNLKNYVYRCGLYDATYWPENGFNKFGSDNEACTGFAIQHDLLIVFKERSIWQMKYDFTGSTVQFPTKPINSTIGCDMPWTIQVIENDPVFFNTYLGGHILLASDVRDERNVKPISGNINGAPFREGILDELKADLLNATSLDYNGKYYICVRNKAWVWDYDLSPYQGNEDTLSWFPYTNINANSWLVVDREYYYGDRTTGALVTKNDNYNDFGSAIEGTWRSKLMAFPDGQGGELIDYLKTVRQIWFNTRANSNSALTIKYYNDNGDVVDSTTIPANQTGSFDWDNWDWDNFTWDVSRFFPPVKRKPKLKKIVYFQIEFSNNVLNENLSILNLVIQYSVDRKVK